MDRSKRKTVSGNNTKSEILQAYEELIKQAEEEVSDDEMSKIQDDIIIKRASEGTMEKATNDLSRLKSDLNQAISQLTDKFTKEAEEFQNLQKAVELSRRELDELHQIKFKAGILKQMILIHKQKEEELEKEIRNKRDLWEEEQKVYQEKQRRDRDREGEEYKYQRMLENKRDQDRRQQEELDWQRRMQLEKEALGQTRQELERLRKAEERFPTDTEKAVTEAVEKALAESKKQAEVEKTFARQEFENALKIAQLKISQLETTLKDQNIDMAQLKKQLEEATRQVKDIAVSVIESKKPENKQSELKPAV